MLLITLRVPILLHFGRFNGDNRPLSSHAAALMAKHSKPRSRVVRALGVLKDPDYMEDSRRNFYVVHHVQPLQRSLRGLSASAVTSSGEEPSLVPIVPIRVVLLESNIVSCQDVLLPLSEKTLQPSSPLIPGGNTANAATGTGSTK